MKEVDYQTRAGRTMACCVSMRWALSCGYVQRGYLWKAESPQRWCSWTLKVQGEGYYDVSPISFCPFCGTCLDKGDE